MEGVYERSPGKWYVVVELPRDNGKRKQKWIRATGCRTQKEAAKFRTRVLNEVNQGDYLESSKQTVTQYLTEWLKVTVSKHRKPSTAVIYESKLRNYVVPHIGNVPLDKVTSQMLQRMYATIIDSGKLQPSSLYNLHSILRSAFNRAVKHGLLKRSPTDGVDITKPATGESVVVLEPDASLVLASRAVDTKLYAPILLYLATGARRSEILALRWQDIDMKRGLIRVTQNIVRVKGQTWFLPPKTKKSRRPITIPASVLPILEQQRQEQQQRREFIGVAWTDKDLVFDRGDGNEYNPSSFSHSFARFVHAQGFDGVTIRALRHGHASLLNALGADRKAISERMGHSTLAVTDDIYTHVFTSTETRIAELLDGFLKK